MSMRALWAVLFVLAPLAAVAGYGSTYGVTSMGGSGGGVTVGDAVSGGTASRLLFSDASTQVSTASPVAVTSSLDLTSGTLDVGGATTLDSTLRVASTADIRGAISNGGSATCDSVGAAGALCVSDTAGTVVSNEGGGDNYALTISTEARASATDRSLLILFDEDTSQWLQLTNGTSVDGSVAPTFWSRADPAASTPGLFFIGGVVSASDSAMTDAPAVVFDGRRENGTPTAPSASALTLRPTFGVRNTGTEQFKIEALGGVHIQDSDDIDAGDCDADAEVGRIRRYAKDASNITLCGCQKVGGAFSWAAIPTGGDCT